METTDQTKMTAQGAVVLTSIALPNDVMKRIAEDCARLRMPFFVIDDTKSPADFALDGCRFLSYEAQRELAFETAQAVPGPPLRAQEHRVLLAI